MGFSILVKWHLYIDPPPPLVISNHNAVSNASMASHKTNHIMQKILCLNDYIIHTPARWNVSVRPTVRSLTFLLCLGPVSNLEHMSPIIRRFAAYWVFHEIPNLDFWQSLWVYNFDLLICPCVGKVKVDSRSECLLQSLQCCMFIPICVPLYICSEVYHYCRFPYLAKFRDITRSGSRRYHCCSGRFVTWLNTLSS